MQSSCGIVSTAACSNIQLWHLQVTAPGQAFDESAWTSWAWTDILPSTCIWICIKESACAFACTARTSMSINCALAGAQPLTDAWLRPGARACQRKAPPQGLQLLAQRTAQREERAHTGLRPRTCNLRSHGRFLPQRPSRLCLWVRQAPTQVLTLYD